MWLTFVASFSKSSKEYKINGADRSIVIHVLYISLYLWPWPWTKLVVTWRSIHRLNAVYSSFKEFKSCRAYMICNRKVEYRREIQAKTIYLLLDIIHLLQTLLIWRFCEKLCVVSRSEQNTTPNIPIIKSEL